MTKYPTFFSRLDLAATRIMAFPFRVLTLLFLFLSLAINYLALVTNAIERRIVKTHINEFPPS